MKKNFFEYLLELSEYYLFIDGYVQKNKQSVSDEYVPEKDYIPKNCISILELSDRWDIDFNVFVTLSKKFNLDFNIGWKIDHNIDEKIRIFMLFVNKDQINTIEGENEQLDASAKKYMIYIQLYKSIKVTVEQLSQDIDSFIDCGYFYSRRLFYEKVLSNKVLNINLLNENYDTEYHQYAKRLNKYIEDKNFVQFGKKRAILDYMYNRYKYLSILSITEKKYNFIKSNALLSYLIESRKKHMSDKEIAENLLKRGYSKEVVGAVLRQDDSMVTDFSQWLEKSVLGIKRKKKTLPDEEN